MWGPTEKCTECGGTTIRECDDGDPVVGYCSTEWRCMDCGAICEEAIPERPALVPPRKPVTVATIADDVMAALAVDDRKEVA